MPKSPKGQKRPADVIGNAVMVARIATGEDMDGETPGESRASKRKGGIIGGQARAASLTSEKRKEIAKKAAAKRWNT